MVTPHQTAKWRAHHITGVSLETAELLASKYASASELIAASVDEVADTTLKSGRRVGHVVAKRVKLCFC